MDQTMIMFRLGTIYKFRSNLNEQNIFFSFKIRTKVWGQLVTYTTTHIQDDEDMNDTFDMIQATSTVTSIEICTTYNSGTRPSKPNSLTHFDAHHPQPNIEATQEPFDLNTTYLGE